nr:MAG TPA: hypothetical protein [Caudoviricetes sp.]
MRCLLNQYLLRQYVTGGLDLMFSYACLMPLNWRFFPRPTETSLWHIFREISLTQPV